MNYISSLGIDRRSIWTALENKDCKVEVNCGEEIRVKEARPQEQPLEGTKEKRAAKDEVNKKARAGNGGTMAYEETILIDGDRNEKHDTKMRLSRPSIFGRLAQGLAQAVRTVISVVLAPGAFISGCFYDSKGRFSVTLPIKTAAYRLRLSKTGVSVQTVALPAASRETTKEAQAGQGQAELPRRRSSEPEGDLRPSLTNRPMLIDRRSSRAQSSDQDNPSRHTRSKSLPTSTAETGDPATPRRSIRISVLNEDALRQRRLDREKRNSVGSNTEAHLSSNAPLTAKSIKSPTSPASSLGLTKYPRVPAPPRPLVPRRQPSYSHTSAPVTDGPQKTLIIDLDETLIHSMSKGGRMSTGHMVEVKLQNPVGVEGASIGPQVPILYYVHKRPHCDEFLRKVSKWYNLIVFTAAVQEYADPVIDWLELERKYFSARYYRQHCTFRNGAYIKDVGQVEPDLSKVMILDNSPISYTFHEDNAIPIEGWISDPSDNDLLHLIPLLEGLQYTTDVRALLALRLGEATV